MLKRSFNTLEINIKTVAEAPNYNTGANEGAGFKGAKILKAIVIKGGKENGKPTVDLQFEDEKGQKHVAMITGDLILGLANVVNVV